MRQAPLFTLTIFQSAPAARLGPSDRGSRPSRGLRVSAKEDLRALSRLHQIRRQSFRLIASPIRNCWPDGAMRVMRPVMGVRFAGKGARRCAERSFERDADFRGTNLPRQAAAN